MYDGEQFQVDATHAQLLQTAVVLSSLEPFYIGIHYLYINLDNSIVMQFYNLALFFFN